MNVYLIPCPELKFLDSIMFKNSLTECLNLFNIKFPYSKTPLNLISFYYYSQF